MGERPGTGHSTAAGGGVTFRGLAVRAVPAILYFGVTGILAATAGFLAVRYVGPLGLLVPLGLIVLFGYGADLLLGRGSRRPASDE